MNFQLNKCQLADSSESFVIYHAFRPKSKISGIKYPDRLVIDYCVSRQKGDFKFLMDRLTTHYNLFYLVFLHAINETFYNSLRRFKREVLTSTDNTQEMIVYSGIWEVS